MVYVKNNGQYKLTFSAVKTTEVPDATGHVSLVKTPVFTKEFGVLVKDSLTGKIHHTGFTPLEESVFEELFNTSVPFLKAIKAGTLSKYDEAPPEALLDSELLDNAQSEIERLRREVSNLNEILSSGGGKTVSSQLKEAAKKQKELEEVIEAQKAAIAALNEEIAALTDSPAADADSNDEDETPEF